ncbi:MAG TPA: FHA domain-containing protein [Acidimicrobiales bacterium]|nr:FHA domain-containing protein [Acidimicrobiales bacterium]
MPDSLLTILKFCFLALLYLFFIRVLRAVWAEMSGATTPAPAAPAPAAPRASRGWGGATRGGGNGRGGGRLRVIEPAERKGQTYELAEELTVGRAGGCQITLDDTYVSQLHARVFRRDGQLYVEDLGSTNGTYLNRKKVTAPIAIRKGDRLQIGKTVMELQ